MRDFLVLEGTNDVVDAVDVLDVAEEMVAQTLALRCTPHDTGDINNLEHCRNFGLRVVHIAQLAEAVVRHRNHGLVWLDRAEGVILGRDVQV